MGYLPSDGADNFTSCPLKGLRAVELAAGQLETWTSDMAKQLSSELVAHSSVARSSKIIARLTAGFPPPLDVPTHERMPSLV